MHETSRTVCEGHLCGWKQAACLCAAGALSIDLSTPFHCLNCPRFETPPRVKGLFSCCHSVGVFCLSGRPYGTHTQAQICCSYLIFRFLPSASVQPYLDTTGHTLIFCAGISQHSPLSLLIEAMIADTTGSGVHLSGKRKRKNKRNK